MGLAVTCPQCGKSVNSDEGVVDCPDCGRPLPPPAEVVETQHVEEVPVTPPTPAAAKSQKK